MCNACRHIILIDKGEQYICKHTLSNDALHYPSMQQYLCLIFQRLRLGHTVDACYPVPASQVAGSFAGLQ